jgi:hypothetical protein
MTTHYKGQRIDELLEIIKEMENRLKAISTDPFSMSQHEELAQGYSTLIIAKAKLTAIQGEK